MELKHIIKNYADFPKKGILFRDINPLLEDHKCFNFIIKELKNRCQDIDIKYIVGIESRGFIFGSSLAKELKKGFIVIRKEGKLPGQTIKQSYNIEYGKATMEMQKDAIRENDKVIIIDDLLATGGTALAAANLIKKLKGKVMGFGFVIELTELNGRKILNNYDVHSLVKY